MADYRLDGPGSNSSGGFSAHPDRPWGSPSLLYNGYQVFPGGKVRPERAADHPPTSNAMVMEEYSYTSTHPLGHTGLVTGTLLLVTRWQSSGKSTSQLGINPVYSSTSWIMCAVLFGMIFYSPMADGWPGSTWRFWSNPFLIVPIAPLVTGTVFILIFHVLLTSISRSLYLPSFQFFHVNVWIIRYGHVDQ